MSENNLLRRAVHSEEVPSQLQLRVLKAIRAEAQTPVRSSPWRWMVPSLAAAAFAAFAVAFLLPKTDSQPTDAYIATVASKVSTLMRVGLGDHIHCAVFRKYPKTPDPAEKMKRELGPEYFPLMAAVKANAPAGFTLQMAHQCRFQGRRFIHLVLKNGGEIMSVVVAPTQDRETLAAERLVPAMSQSGITFYQQGAAEYQIAAFESGGYFVYLISSQTEEKNLRLMLAMSVGLNGALPKS